MCTLTLIGHSGVSRFGSALTSGFSEAILCSTLMMTVAGIVTALVLRKVPVDSWRLQSFLAAAVLLQGLMLVRVPVHLGWIQPDPATQTIAASPTSHALPAAAQLPSDDPGELTAGSLATALMRAEVTGSTFPETFRRVIAAIPWRTTAGAVWLLGVVLLAGWSLSAYVRLLCLIRRLDTAPPSWRAQWKQLAGSQHQCGMLVSRSAGPLMVRRPSGYVFVVPEEYWNELSEHQREGVILHELAHLQRHDVWRQLLVRMIATLHWFNPVAWWAMWRYEQAAELACDGRVRQAGEKVSAGFASALVQFVAWNQRSGVDLTTPRGIGLQAMAAPPLSSRITRLLKPNSIGDSKMKRFVLALFALAVISVAFIQIRLTAADGELESADAAKLSVLPESIGDRLSEVIGRLDISDDTTARFASLAESTSGRLAIGAYLNSLRNREMEEARLEAVPRFLERHFSKTEDGKYHPRADQADVYARWEKKSTRLADSLEKLGIAMTDIASNLNDKDESSALMKRFMNDAQAPATLLLFDQQGGGDLISRYISKAFGEFLVDRGDGAFQIVQSKRGEAEDQIRKLEAAGKIRKKLTREFPLWADELDASDDQHQKFVRYLKDPMMASVVSVVLLKEHKGNPAMAVEELFNNLEKGSVDTAKGLRIQQPEIWDKLDEIYRQVDRLGGLLPRVQERLLEVAETLSKDDPLAKRLAAILGDVPVALVAGGRIAVCGCRSRQTTAQPTERRVGRSG